MKKPVVTKFNNNFGIQNGVKLLNKYFDFKINKKKK